MGMVAAQSGSRYAMTRRRRTRAHWFVEPFTPLAFSYFIQNQASPPNADTAGDTEDDTCTPAYKEDVLFHTCRLVLAVIVHDGARPSDWYDAESHGEVWTCPLLGCRHVVDPLSLDDEACHVVHSVLGVGGTSIDPWTSESVLARECEYDRRTNCCRLSMSPGEITHRRMCIDMIAWHHIEREHLRGYGVLVCNKGKAEDVEDAEAGIVRPYKLKCRLRLMDSKARSRARARGLERGIRYSLSRAGRGLDSRAASGNTRLYARW